MFIVGVCLYPAPPDKQLYDDRKCTIMRSRARGYPLFFLCRHEFVKNKARTGGPKTQGKGQFLQGTLLDDLKQNIVDFFFPHNTPADVAKTFFDKLHSQNTALHGDLPV